MEKLFVRFATLTAKVAGKPWTFIACLAVVILWAVTGPIFKFSDTWQLVINTGTTIVTFLMVFLIQHTQNRDTVAVHIKLDELIRATRTAHNSIVSLEDLDDVELERLRQRYDSIAEEARKRLKKGINDTGSPTVHGRVPQKKEV